MSARPVRMVVAVVLAIAATWFVTRPAFGGHADAVQWRATLKDGPFDLAADADAVAVTTSAFSVYLVGADGHVRWRAVVDDLGIGQPALGADVVVVGGETSVTALERADGAVRWSRPRAAPAHSLAAVDDTVLVGDDAGTLSALDATTGVERWSSQYPGALWSGARVDVDHRVVVASWHQSDQPAVRVFDLTTGALRWEAPSAQYSAAPAVHGGRVFVAAGDGNRHARVEARDLVTGALEWQTPVPASFEEAIEPAADDHAVAVVDHVGGVTVLDPATGRLRWQHDLADVLIGTRLVLTSRRVAFTSYAGVLHVLDRRDGHVVERLTPAELGGLPVATVAVPGRQSGRLLLALRLHDWGVQLRKLA